MTIINITIPFGLIQNIQDYSRIINDILKHEISLNILKFSTTSVGLNLLIDIPEEKIQTITQALRENSVQINRKGRVNLDHDLCINCGACISLCPTEALYYKEDNSIDYSDDKCIGCLICLDSCPRHAIKESK